MLWRVRTARCPSPRDAPAQNLRGARGTDRVRFAGPGDPERKFGHDMIPAVSNHPGDGALGNRKAMRPIQKTRKGRRGRDAPPPEYSPMPGSLRRQERAGRQLLATPLRLAARAPWLSNLLCRCRCPWQDTALHKGSQHPLPEIVPIIDKRWNGHIDRLTGDAARLILSCHLFSTATAVLLTWRYIDVLI